MIYEGTSTYFEGGKNGLVAYGDNRNSKKAEKQDGDCVAITLGFIGVLTAGAFTSRLMAEVVYWLPAFSAALKNLQVIESEKTMELTPR